MPLLRWSWRVAAAGAALALAAAAPATAQTPEYAVKAAYLYKFAPFVTWRDSAFGADGAPAVICVQGTDPFGVLLDRAVAGQKIDGRPIVVRRLTTVARNAECHILYVAGGADQSAAAALQAVGGQPVLTVTDAAQHAQPTGVMHFVRIGTKVRFEVDMDAARAQGLQISSKLLALAARVRQ